MFKKREHIEIPDELKGTPAGETFDFMMNKAPRSFFDWSMHQFVTMITLGLLCLPIGWWLRGYTGIDASVDGILMTDNEKDIVRGHRVQRMRLQEKFTNALKLTEESIDARIAEKNR